MRMKYLFTSQSIALEIPKLDENVMAGNPYSDTHFFISRKWTNMNVSAAPAHLVSDKRKQTKLTTTLPYWNMQQRFKNRICNKDLRTLVIDIEVFEAKPMFLLDFSLHIIYESIKVSI